jgi:hypothetical protein
MTISDDARRANLNEALNAFLIRLGDRQFVQFDIVRADFPDILPTTWTDLTERRWLRDLETNREMYRLTPLGYVKALKVSDMSDTPRFREQLGNICKVLKDSLKGRTEFAFVIFQDLVKQSGVSEAFAYNAIDADLIVYVLKRVGAQWDGNHLLKVPHNFGMPILEHD